MIEVDEYFETNSTPSFGQLPSKRIRAVGAMLGNTPILCGGRDELNGNYLDTCISYQDSECSQSHSMVQKRWHAAGVLWVWVFGLHRIHHSRPNQ